ncbi:MAG: hypothetical protein L0Z53_04200 [Acidobacteriales bacterium]|nr:hypothetical protein [Terriglobales bacterium]
MAEQAFKPGESVPQSGLYLVQHAGHRADHEATLFQGEQFPACAQCDLAVRFTLLRAVGPISSDSDFGRKKARGHSRSN